jgi:hypothetical protein
MVCQCRFNQSCNKRPTVEEDVEIGEYCMCVRSWDIQGFSISCSICCEHKTALKNKVFF